MWRSLVAHLTGGQGVAGSNPVIPTSVYAGRKVITAWAGVAFFMSWRHSRRPKSVMVGVGHDCREACAQPSVWHRFGAPSRGRRAAWRLESKPLRSHLRLDRPISLSSGTPERPRACLTPAGVLRQLTGAVAVGAAPNAVSRQLRAGTFCSSSPANGLVVLTTRDLTAPGRTAPHPT